MRTKKLTAIVLILCMLLGSAEASAASNAVVSKVNQIVSSLITENTSAYKRTKLLHDWLTNNANYDYSYTNYDPDGVLLEGSGVCQSYATAYDLLLEAAGITTRIVASDAINHSWNMVQLDDEWYHVDCTWDDPGTGGNENHEYFLLSDDDIVGDHVEWSDVDYNNYEYIYEESVAANGNRCDLIAEGDYGDLVLYDSLSAAKKHLSQCVANGDMSQFSIRFKYDGSDDTFGEICEWAWETSHDGYLVDYIVRA